MNARQHTDCCHRHWKTSRRRCKASTPCLANWSPQRSFQTQWRTWPRASTTQCLLAQMYRSHKRCKTRWLRPRKFLRGTSHMLLHCWTSMCPPHKKYTERWLPLKHDPCRTPGMFPRLLVRSSHTGKACKWNHRYKRFQPGRHRSHDSSLPSVPRSGTEMLRTCAPDHTPTH